jgi:hypothetical protein
MAFRIVLAVVWAAIGLASIVPATMTAFLFDAPGSTSSPLTVGLALTAALLPVCFVAGALLQWVVGVRHAFYIVPLVDFAAIVIIVVAMEGFCGGNLAC